MLQRLWEKETLLADAMGKGNPTLISRTLFNTPSFDSKTQLDFINLPKKVAVIAADAMGK